MMMEILTFVVAFAIASEVVGFIGTLAAFWADPELKGSLTFSALLISATPLLNMATAALLWSNDSQTKKYFNKDKE